MSQLALVCSCLSGVLVFGASLFAAPNQAQHLDFSRDVKPILAKHCLDCHGEETAESNLRLDSPAYALRGGDSGEPAIVPGDSAGSYLIDKIEHTDASERMPPDVAPLSSKEIAILKRWVATPELWRAAQTELAQQTIQHWSFQPLQRPAVPKTAPHPIDAFISAKREAAGLTASPRASRRKLLRRLHLVMHGLPPTPSDLARLEAHNTDWAALVSDILSSPRYGERWAGHWLDLVRFGETTGFETNRERPNAWHYRDWVIRAFNDDKPYDNFVRAQLAGDAMGDGIGTGFLVAGPNDIVKGRDKLLRLTQRQDELADMINTTGTAFLGLTLGCARCHNHKFDPVSQTDYYAMQAVFAGVNHADRKLAQTANAKQRLAGLDREVARLKSALQRFIVDPKGKQLASRPAVNALRNEENFAQTRVRYVRFTIDATNNAQPCVDELEIFSNNENIALATKGAKASSSGDFVHPLHKLAHINDGQYGNPHSWISAKRAGGWVQIELPQPKSIDRIVWARDREGRYKDRLATKYRIEGSLDGQTWQLISSSVDRLPFASPPPPPPVYAFDNLPADQAAAGRKQLVKFRQLQADRKALTSTATAYVGTFQQPGMTHRLYRGDPTTPREQVAPAGIQSLGSLQLAANAPEQNRRLAMADWIAADDNPLTARVIVNRLWQFHFGTGIVDSPSDFGANGTKPSHPELLDWLACELIANKWSLKHMQRLILTSQTWQQDSRPNLAAMKIDAGSRLLWRFPPRRLEAEAIRDSILSVSGKLDLTMGGPGFSGFEVEAENVRHYHPKQNFGPADWRRMIYMTKVRQERDAVFGVFDCPDNSQVVPKRSRSTTPLQALNLLNSKFVMQQAEFVVVRLKQHSDSTHGRIEFAYQLFFGRAPSADETSEAQAFVAEAGWLQFSRVLLNANEFVFIP